MKKVIAFILAVLYLSTSMGATVHLHYCMGKLVDWGLLDHGSKDCTSCGMPKLQSGSGEGCIVEMKGCCHDEHKHFKNEKDQKAGQASFDLAKITPVIADPSYIGQDPFVNSLVVDQPSDNGPPLLNGLPLFLRYCNFRI